MNTLKILLTAFLFMTCTACSEQGDPEQQKSLGKHSKENQKQLAESPSKQASAFQKEEVATHATQNSEAHFCDNKEKIDIWFWPEGATIDNAKFSVPRPNIFIEQGIDLKDQKQFERNGEQVASTSDLNNDMLLDLITAGYCSGGSGCMYSIYINCGSKRFYHVSNFDPYAFGIEVYDNPESNWKRIKTLNQDADPSSLDEGQDIIYEFVKSSYQPVHD